MTEITVTVQALAEAVRDVAQGVGEKVSAVAYKAGIEVAVPPAFEAGRLYERERPGAATPQALTVWPRR
jgi:hypothetical protein